ncbi:cadherin repeat domain-containing protein, partial [Bathymodiolus thermophilus thioautotrophic gill symbiont]
KFTLNGTTLTFAATDFEARADDNTYEVEITASKTGEDNAIQTIIVTLNNIFENTVTINDQALSVDENASIDDNIGTLVTTGTVTAFTISTGNDNGFFKINNTGRIQVARTDLDYETKQSYALTVKIEGDDAKDETAQITITINNLLENTLAIADQTRSVEESAITDTNIGAPLITTGTITTFSITAGNDKNFFKIDNIGQIQVAKTGLDYETKQSYTLTVKIEDADAEDKTAQINIEITDVDDIAPTNIVLTHNNITLNAPIGTIIGTLSATDIDTDIDTKDLTYSVVNNTNFEITGNQLKVKTTPSTIATLNLNITASDGTNTSTPQAFTIAVIDNNTPIIKQFIVTQDGNNGRLISKNGGDVTVQAVVSASSYTWDSSSLTNKNSGNSTTFVFDPTNINSGTHAIKLKVEANSNYSERTLQLKLIAESVTSNDSDGDGIPDDKDTSNANNKIQAGEGKAIISTITDAKILLGVMGEYSGQLTLDQVKGYLAANNLTNNANNASTIGDIYDYVVEGLGATTFAEVIIELSTAIPAAAELYKYSLVNGWSGFVTNDDNTIKSKTSETCTDNSPWEIGLFTGATCLKLTIKDGGENDTDGNQVNNKGQVNGVVESTVSIVIPTPSDIGGSGDSGSGGGGCVYNPNAPARFDMGFILLMVLGAYYLLRRKRRLIR